jgi:hypothetical protein
VGIDPSRFGYERTALPIGPSRIPKSREKAIGVVYKVQLPEETGDALGDDVKFDEEGTDI